VLLDDSRPPFAERTDAGRDGEVYGSYQMNFNPVINLEFAEDSRLLQNCDAFIDGRRRRPGLRVQGVLSAIRRLLLEQQQGKDRSRLEFLVLEYQLVSADLSRRGPRLTPTGQCAHLLILDLLSARIHGSNEAYSPIDEFSLIDL
jgi:hypothetical protein